MATTQGERITAMEVEVKNLREEVKSLREDVSATNEKLDELLKLKNQGMGAFWLVSVIFGTSVLGVISWAFGLIKP